jgi:hypothetical protein
MTTAALSASIVGEALRADDGRIIEYRNAA